MFFLHSWNPGNVIFAIPRFSQLKTKHWNFSFKNACFVQPRRCQSETKGLYFWSICCALSALFAPFFHFIGLFESIESIKYWFCLLCCKSRANRTLRVDRRFYTYESRSKPSWFIFSIFLVFRRYSQIRGVLSVWKELSLKTKQKQVGHKLRNIFMQTTGNVNTAAFSWSQLHFMPLPFLWLFNYPETFWLLGFISQCLKRKNAIFLFLIFMHIKSIVL